MTFKDIPGYEGFYQVNKQGVVRSLDRIVLQHSGTQCKKGRILKTAIGRDGYVKCALSKNNKLSTFTVHRLVGMVHVPNPLNYKELNHLDGNKQNNNDWNLQWCDRGINIRHAYANSLIPIQSGDLHHRSFFRQAEHPAILDLKKSGLKTNEIASIFGCSYDTIHRIILKHKRL